MKVAPSERHAAVAQRLLEQFGFPESDQPRGLATVLAELDRLKAEVHTADARSLRSIVTDASAQLEFVVHVLVRFLCQAVWQRPPEVFLHDHGRLEAGHQLAKCSLGKLLEHLEFVSKQLATEESPRIAVFRRDFDERRLAPKGATSIAGLRNAFAHFEREASNESLADQRRRAREFFVEAIKLLEHFRCEGSRVFPIVVRVEAVQFDRFGRKTVVAVSDEGLREQIFTDTTLAPGQIYFMHPLTNPLRVDPILVKGGELWSDGPARPTAR